MSDNPSPDTPLTSLFLGPAEAPYEYRGGKLAHNLILFGRVCRALGMGVTPNRMMEVARALAHIQLGRKQDFYYTLRAHLVTRRRDIAYFDEAFDLFWRRPADGFTTFNLQSLGEERRKRKTQFLPPLDASPSEEGADAKAIDSSMIALVPTYSQQERLRNKDFAEMSAAELELAKRAIAKMPDSLGMRRTRRFERGKGRQIDMRRLMKEYIRKQGDVTRLPTHRHKEKPRPVVLLCDISGSMERYTRVLLHFMHSLAGSLTQVESFVYSTDITRITRQIRQKNVDEALADIGATVLQWGGGTMTGECLRRFNWHWARRVLGRGAVVMLITDGWDRGDIPLLHKEMARLKLACRRLIWLNPLLDVPEYEPLTRGAQALLPYVHDFLPITNLANLDAIVTALQNLAARPSAEAYRQAYLTPAANQGKRIKT
ncbi:MAG: VWA domain-containing protein [Chloroflexi bacterium]|nr:VWA domain-containing protein [Chloroflexota bacterium]MCY3582785.1 VWA domain-containing protein [Chloroflexota bacterium]MCY3716140.1 VWA domain-containing protein [Chloroflexota bacterium]MDE2650958.1 VWA domain-containing protein [Chloroflexota bacterium]MXX51681.1 VWA domain-containing protein [Chloroflexota bacterium]